MVTCATCGGKLTKDWGGYGHLISPDKRHVVKPIDENGNALKRGRA